MKTLKVTKLCAGLGLMLTGCVWTSELWGSDIRLQLYHDGTNTLVYLNGKHLTQPELGKKIKTVSEISSSVLIPVLVCPDVPFKDVIATASTIRNAGITNIAVEMRKWGETPVASQVRFGVLPMRKFKIVYHGETLNAVPEDEGEKSMSDVTR